VEEPFLSAFNVQGVNDVRQTEIQEVEPLMSEPSAFEVEMTDAKLERHKSPGLLSNPSTID